MPLVQTGIQAGIGAIGKKKEQKAAAAAEGGGDAAPAKEAKGGAAAEGPDKEGGAEQAIDRFMEKLNDPNLRSIQDIKAFRDQVLGKMQELGLAADKKDDATKKLNQAILKKLGIGKPGPNGSVVVDMTQQNQQVLAALGMKPDRVGAPEAAQGGGAQPGAPQAGPEAVPQAAAPGPAAAPAG